MDSKNKIDLTELITMLIFLDPDRHLSAVRLRKNIFPNYAHNIT